MARPREYVEAPPVTPLPYGLLSAALVQDDLTGHRQFGVAYESEACGTVHLTAAACEADPDFGTITITVDAEGVASISVDGAPARTTYTVRWGDGTPDQDVAWDLDGATHAYAAAGTYPVRVSDDRVGYVAELSAVVTEGEATEPLEVEARFLKVIGSDGVPLVYADPFTLYTIFECAPVGVDLEDRAARAMRSGEQRAVEQAVAERLAVAEDAVDLSDGGTFHPAEALAMLEKYAAENYGGVPVIHSPRNVTSLLSDRIARYGARLETVQGALIASGGGYHSLRGPALNIGDPASTQGAGFGEAWMYVTGQVVVRRAPTVDATPMTMSRTPATNVARVLAERPYAVSWECVTAAVKVHTHYEDGVLGAVPK